MNQYEPIKDFETYGINKLGEIKDYRTGKLLPCGKNPDGYRRCILVNPTTKKHFLVHRLVCIQFLPNPNNYKEVDHIDRNPENNQLTNLRWCDDFLNAQNKGTPKNNKLKHKYIRYENCPGYYNSRYRIQITKNKKKIFDKSLRTTKYNLDDAVRIRNEFLTANNMEIID